ncbi:hypothetical protein ACIOMM_34905 [Streptomyces sp. NPDC087908]|uniref:hypothetical protein n=1 Tax=Streptomyces sp. NPDC087908 TaxID=3365820 RepID=UPI003811AE5A
MTMSNGTAVERAVETLRRHHGRCSREPAEPHPQAPVLSLPDGTPAPHCLRVWATLDNRYPLGGRRTTVPLADDRGVLLVRDMKDILREVCIESVADELEDVPEALEGVWELVSESIDKFPGYRVVLAEEQPDPVLWISPSGSVTYLRYRHEAFAAR